MRLGGLEEKDSVRSLEGKGVEWDGDNNEDIRKRCWYRIYINIGKHKIILL